MSNNVSMKMIKSEVNKYKEVIDINFKDIDPNTYETKEYTIKFHPYFDPDRVSKVLENLSKDLNEIASHKELDFDDKILPLFIEYHLIMEFSNLPQTKSKDITKRVAYFQEFIKTKYFKMVDEHMVQDEFNQVWDRIMKTMAANEKIERMIAKTQNDIRNYNFKSPELKEKVLGKKIPEA